MPNQSASTLPYVSSEENFRVQLRDGQEQLLKRMKRVAVPGGQNIKWPGGYGKSLGIASAFRELVRRRECDRLLIVVANDTQRKQILNDFRHDCLDVALHIGEPWAFNNEHHTQRKNLRGDNVVFVTTIQQVSACHRASSNLLLCLMQHGDWMLAADEYHHYAIDRDWGESLTVLKDAARFCLATSATPSRSTKEGDNGTTIFGQPDMVVSYQAAKRENAVKPILRRMSEFRIDYLDGDDLPVTFSASELREAAGSAAKVDTFEAKQRLRHSRKYVHPILSDPLARLIDRRIETGQPLQLLVRCMSCSHAKSTCEQIREITDLKVDWIGTGDFGRPDHENAKVKAAFCPPKDTSGKRPEPELDVLVQVAMADEGFDSIMVAEIADLACPTLMGASNKTKQFYKRGTRFVGEGIELIINVGKDHPLCQLEGNQIEEWIDSNMTVGEIKDSVPPKETDDDWPSDWEPPEFPAHKDNLLDCQLTEVEIDNHPVRRKFEIEARKDRPDATNADISRWLRKALASEDKERSEQRTYEQQRKAVNQLSGSVAAKAMRQLHPSTFEKSMLADCKRRINAKLLRRYGPRESMLEADLKNAYDYLVSIHESVVAGEVPEWLR